MNQIISRVAFAFLLAVSTATTGHSEEFPSDQVQRIVKEGIQAGKCPGAVVAIGFDGRTVFQSAFGDRQVEPTKVPMTEDTIFDLASLTKPIATATSVMILADQGKISIDDPVSQYLPDFASHDKESVTIRHLLLHTSGLIPDNGMSDYKGTHAKSIANLMNQKLRSPPGTRFRYSDVGFMVLGELVEQVSGKPLNEFAQQNIFKPLKMKDTNFRSIGQDDERCATTQQREGHWMRGEVHDPRCYALGGVAGHAGLFSTAEDLSKLATVLLKSGKNEDVSLFSQSTFDAMTTGIKVPGASEDQNHLRSLGWDKQSGYSSNRGKSMSESAFGHGGFTGTAIWIDPEQKLYVIFLSSRVHPDGKGSVNSLAGEIGTIAADWAIEQLRSSETR